MVSPYKNFTFQLTWKGRCIAGFSGLVASRLRVDFVEWKMSPEPSVVMELPEYSQYHAISLEHGLADNGKFLTWVRRWLPTPNAKSRGGAKSREDFSLKMVSKAGTPIVFFKIKNAWVREFQALPNLPAKGNDVAIDVLTLECEEMKPRKSDRDSSKKKKPSSTSKKS